MGAGTNKKSYPLEEERISHLRFGLKGMKAYYLSYKENRVITENVKFNVESFQTNFPNIANQFEVQAEVDFKTSDPPTSKISDDASISLTADKHVPPKASGLLKIAHMARSHNTQLLKLAKTIPLMILQAIKKVMKLVVDKLGSLCAQMDVLEGEVAAIREELNR
ncbi:hypothetical protein HAX54_039780 [Datura stramonium]|uniref:Uncharacterized protein n=1 Tax=Datura stramonium TaxID=4076 RepID=A0ABS8VRB4_DATST|nr:hypothetical protein [Datura stramonium]